MSSPSLPEIPGYRLLSELGRGGMATVYLAVQISVDREVALKVMSPALLADPSYGVRFLREARIAAKLHHRHVVGVHDVGVEDQFHYIAMEYLPAGPILGPEAPLRDILFALRVVRETAAALDYAHSKGFIHRDVKPDNILLRQDGSAALTDFGIARANDSLTRMTRTGSVIGTPFYMSPEQARGRPLDGRADLYSLGVVFYELLVGKVPFQAPEALAVALKHVTEPVPRLPEPLYSLQPLLDQILAKQPEERFQTGAELVRAIEELEFAIARDEMPELIIPDESFRRQLLMAETRSGLTRHPTPTSLGDSASRSAPSPPRSRSEPSLGSLDDVVAEAGRLLGASGERTPLPRQAAMSSDLPMAPRRVQRKRSALPLLLFGLLLAIGAAGWHWREPLLAQFPDPRGDDVLARAERALELGQLEGEEGAHQLLARALERGSIDRTQLDPLLQQLADAWWARAQSSWDRGDPSAATTALDRLGALPASYQPAEMQRLREDLARGRDDSERLEALLTQAREALDEGRLEGEQGAEALFASALQLDPANAYAQAGMQRIHDDILDKAEQALAVGDMDAAEAHLGDAVNRGVSSARLGQLQSALLQERQSYAARVDQLRRDARGFLERGQLISPPRNNALERFDALLEIDPDDADARRGRLEVADALIVQAVSAIEARAASQARSLISAATAIQPRLPGVADLRLRLSALERELERESRIASLSQSDLDLIAAALERSRAAMQEGRYIDPPGESAYDHLRSAVSVSALHPDVIALRREAGLWLREQADAAMSEANFDRAHHFYDAAELFQPGHADNQALRDTLIEALRAAALGALEGGDLDTARRLIERLGLLDGGSEQFQELRSRVAG